MSVFEKGLSFGMFKNGTGDVSSATGSWQSPGGGSGNKVLEKILPYYFWRADKYLKIKKPIKHFADFTFQTLKSRINTKKMPSKTSGFVGI